MKTWIVNTGYVEPFKTVWRPQTSHNNPVSVQGKFQAFYQYAKTFNSDEFDYEDLKSSDYIFMRWKVSWSLKVGPVRFCSPAANGSPGSDPQEQFLVPDHTIKDISGASFAGFYYICFQKSTATIEGFYYHRSSEW